MYVKRNISSSLEDPVKFFEDFFKTPNILDELKADFFPDPSDEDNYWSDKHTYNIDKENESFDYEFTEEVEWEDDDSIPGYPMRHPIKWEQRVIKIIFKEELNNLLYKQFLLSKRFIDDHIKQSPTVDKAKVSVSFWLSKLLDSWRRCTTSTAFSKYDECFRPIRALIRLLYNEYSIYCPDQTPELKDFLQNSDPSILAFEADKTLSPQFFKEIITYQDQNGNLLFSDMKTAKNDLLLIAGGNLEDIKEPINFLWPKEASYYLVEQLRLYGGRKPTVAEIINSGKITFKGKKSSIEAYNKGVSAFSKKNLALKSKIDTLVESHLTS